MFGLVSEPRFCKSKLLLLSSLRSGLIDRDELPLLLLLELLLLLLLLMFCELTGALLLDERPATEWFENRLDSEKGALLFAARPLLPVRLLVRLLCSELANALWKWLAAD